MSIDYQERAGSHLCPNKELRDQSWSQESWSRDERIIIIQIVSKIMQVLFEGEEYNFHSLQWWSKGLFIKRNENALENCAVG